MAEPYFYVDDELCTAYVEKVTWFFFWNQWYWNAKFYNKKEALTPHAIYDGYADSEDEAFKAICDQYKVEKHR
jgi:hypothetical protein